MRTRTRCLQRIFFELPRLGIETTELVCSLRGVPKRAIGSDGRIVRPRLWCWKLVLLDWDTQSSYRCKCGNRGDQCKDAQFAPTHGWFPLLKIVALYRYGHRPHASQSITPTKLNCHRGTQLDAHVPPGRAAPQQSTLMSGSITTSMRLPRDQKLTISERSFLRE